MLSFVDRGLGPPLLLIHGLMVTGEMFEPVIDRFAAPCHGSRPPWSRQKSQASAAVHGSAAGSRSILAGRSPGRRIEDGAGRARGPRQGSHSK